MRADVTYGNGDGDDSGDGHADDELAGEQDTDFEAQELEQ
jgi:hypothetical protein